MQFVSAPLLRMMKMFADRRTATSMGIAALILAAVHAQDVASSCSDMRTSYLAQHTQCVKSPDNAAAFCGESSCSESLRLYANLPPTCTVGATDMPTLTTLPGVPTTVLSTAFCQPECVSAYVSLQSTYMQCHEHKGPTKNALQCQACQRYTSSVSALVSSCGFNGTAVPALKAAVAGDAAQCEQTVRTNVIASNETSGSSISPFLVSGLAVGILVLATILYIQKRRVNILHVFQTKEAKRGKKQHEAPYQAFEIHNDIRYDDAMGPFWHAQNKLSQISLRSKGGFGLVYSATLDTSDARGKIRVALKQLLPDRTADSDQIEAFMNEIRLASQLNHPNIVPFVGFTWSSVQDIAMITEFMPNGDLHKLLAKEFKMPPAKRTLSWSVETLCNKLNMAANVIDALAYLHGFSPSIIHRDLKSKNILLGATFQAYVTDFGVSRQSSSDVDAVMTARVGTSAWIAPEVLRGEKYTHQADMYSFGVLLAELDTLQEPYKDATLQPDVVKLSPGKLASKIAQGKLVPAFTAQVPPFVLSIASKCLAYDYTTRPSATQVAMEMNSFLIQDHQRLSHYPAVAHDAYAAL
ncbi:Aste57867_17916 [Aphanomyces stellatus]|uniref:Aste57867_17916 protein n=1 Tax=Aphanomyces stellatus TaxID=120398 RepID=A0A485LAH6_9STRA|nr:hypothetical protein As57867_017855 [Aphanomyces stellatus]VFT94658.1 Aste57867_17916 [Aphanomyces stellatus]